MGAPTAQDAACVYAERLDEEVEEESARLIEVIADADAQHEVSRWLVDAETLRTYSALPWSEEDGDPILFTRPSGLHATTQVDALTAFALQHAGTPLDAVGALIFGALDVALREGVSPDDLRTLVDLALARLSAPAAQRVG